jgi:O-antigen ligase
MGWDHAATRPNDRPESFVPAYHPSKVRAQLTAGRVLLFAAAFAGPLAFGAVEPWAWALLDLSLIAVFVLWMLAALRARMLTIVWSPFYIVAALFIQLGLWQVLSYSTFNSIATRNSIVMLCSEVIGLFTVVQLVSDTSEKFWHRLGVVCFVYTFTLSAFSIVQSLTSPNVIYWLVPVDLGSVFGPYVNRNNYAGLMEMLIPLAAVHFLSRPRGDPWRWLLAISLVFPISSVLLSGSRGGLISLSFETVVFLILLRGKLPRIAHLRVQMWAGLIVLSGVLVFFVLDPGGAAEHLSSLGRVAKSAEATFGERGIAVRDSLRIFKDYPVTGIGLGSFEKVFPRYQTFPSDAIWDHAHNDYVEAVVESGSVGAILITAALMLFFRLAFVDRPERLTTRLAWFKLGSTAGCCGILAHSLVDFNLHIPANATWFIISLALSTMPLRLGPQSELGQLSLPGVKRSSAVGRT